MNEKILVLLSSYNGAKYIRTQIDSILSQRMVDVYLLIRDDGSTDNTTNIIDSYINNNQGRIELLKGQNVGYALSFTELIRKAYNYYDFDYYAFADQDDYWLPTKLCAAINLIKNELPQIPVAYCSNTTLVDENLSVLRPCWNIKPESLTKPRTLVQSFATGCTMVFNRRAVELYALRVTEGIKVHDYHMYQICMFLGKVIYDEQSYIYYRQHSNNQIGKPSFLKRMKIRMKGNSMKNIHETRNRNFLEAYKDLLTAEDRTLISKFIGYKESLFDRLKLLFSTKITCANSFEANFFLKLKIFLGTV